MIGRVAMPDMAMRVAVPMIVTVIVCMIVMMMVVVLGHGAL